jgi:glutaredoxin
MYNNLSSYNEGSRELPATVLSSKFQTILDNTNHSSEHDKFSVLTYGVHDVSYPTVNSAYGKEFEPHYVVMREPDGKVVRKFKGVETKESETPKPIMNQKNCNVKNEPIVERFKNYDSILKDLDIVLFVDKKCKYCIKQLDMNFSKNFKILDIKERDIKQKFTDLGGFATPFFHSKNSGRSFTGVLESPQKALDALGKSHHDYKKKVKLQHSDKGKHKEHKLYESNEKYIDASSNSDLYKQIKDLDIVVYSSNGCPHCTTFKNMCKEENVLPYIDIVEDSSKMDRISEVKGFPTLFSKKTNKTMTGAPPNLSVMIDYLS